MVTTRLRVISVPGTCGSGADRASPHLVIQHIVLCVGYNFVLLDASDNRLD